MPQTYLQLKVEIARRLRELRRTATNDLSPEEIAARAKDQGVSIGARTIRDYEENKGEPSIDKLHSLLSYYGVTLGEFLRFTVEDEEGKLIADLLDLIRSKPKMKKVMKTLIATIREQ